MNMYLYVCGCVECVHLCVFVGSCVCVLCVYKIDKVCVFPGTEEGLRCLWFSCLLLIGVGVRGCG